MLQNPQDVVATALALATAILVIGTFSQGRLEHALRWALGPVPRGRPSMYSRIPHREHYWSVIGRLGQDAPEESPERAA